MTLFFKERMFDRMRSLCRSALTLSGLVLTAALASPSAIRAQTSAGAAVPMVRDSIPNNAYQGWKQYEVNCARCHGEFGVGSSFAPSLVVALKDGGTIPDQAAFVTTVCQGRKDKGMPSWCEVGLEMDKMINMYAYLKLRADGKVRAGRPAVKEDS